MFMLIILLCDKIVYLKDFIVDFLCKMWYNIVYKKGAFMNFKEIENTFAEDKDLFVEKFGYFLMKVSRKDLPKLVEMALKLQNEVINKKIENNIHFLLRNNKKLLTI